MKVSNRLRIKKLEQVQSLKNHKSPLSVFIYDPSVGFVLPDSDRDQAMIYIPDNGRGFFISSNELSDQKRFLTQ